MDCLPVSQNQMAALSSGDGPKFKSTSTVNPPMQAPSSLTSKIPRYVNHGNKCSTVPKGPDVDLPRKIIFPPKRPVDDIPRLDIPSSPDTGDDGLTSTSSETSTLLSPSQSGDGSLVTLDSWKSGCVANNSGRCLCRRGNRSLFHNLINRKDNEENSTKKIDEMNETFDTSGLGLSFDSSLSNKDSGDEADTEAEAITVRTEKGSCVAKVESEEKCTTTDSEEINVSLGKPLSFQFSRSENTCTSTTPTEETIDQSVFLKAKESEPFFCPVEPKPKPKPKNVVGKETRKTSSPCLNAVTRTESNELQNRLQKMIDYGKNILSVKRSNVTLKSDENTNLDRGESSKKNQVPFAKDSVRTNQSGDNSLSNQSNLWQSVKLLTDGIFTPGKDIYLPSPHLCLMSSKYSNSSTTEDWYNTSRDHLSSCDRRNNYITSKSCYSKNQLVDIKDQSVVREVIPSLQTSQSTILTEEQRSVGVQVDLIEWDLFKKSKSEVQNIGIQVNMDSYSRVRPAVRTRTLVCDLSTPVLNSPMSSLSVKSTTSRKFECESRDSSLVNIVAKDNLFSCSHACSIPVLSTLQKNISPTKSTANLSKSPILNLNFSNEAIDIASTSSLPSSSDDNVEVSEDITSSLSQIKETSTTSTTDTTDKYTKGKFNQSIPKPISNMCIGDKSRDVKERINWKIGARSSSSSTTSTLASKIPGLKMREAHATSHKNSTSAQQLLGLQQNKQQYPSRRRQPVDSLRPNASKKGSEKWGKNLHRVKGTNSTDTSHFKRPD